MQTRILVIEDDSSVAGLLEDLLTEAGFTVMVERDGEWGLRTFEARGADLVLLDILLPKVQGFDLLPRLRALPGGESVPIVVMSGVFRSATYREQLARRHDVHAYFDKPLDTEALLASLRSALGDRYPEAPKPRPRRAAGAAPGATPLASAGPERPVEVPSKGDIESMPFARLLGLCFRGRVTGALMLRRESIKKILYFKEGVPVFVRSNLLDECLGRIMVEERLITQKECERSLELKRKSDGKRQGEILVDMGSISQHNLQFALELQMQMKLYEVFSWQDGTFQLNPQADYTGPQVALSMGPTALIHEGAGRAMSTERIKRDLDKLSHRPLLPSTDPTFRYQAQQLDPDADLLLDLIDGTRNADTLLDSTELNTDAAALLLYALFCTGLLRAPAAPPALPEAPVSVGDDDLEVLRTDEIDAVAALEQIDPELAGKARARALLEATKGTGTTDDIDVVEAPTLRPDAPELYEGASAEALIESEAPDEVDVETHAERLEDTDEVPEIVEAKAAPPPAPPDSDDLEPEVVAVEAAPEGLQIDESSEPEPAPEATSAPEERPELDESPSPGVEAKSEAAEAEVLDAATLDAEIESEVDVEGDDDAPEVDVDHGVGAEVEDVAEAPPAPRPAPPVSPLGPEPGASFGSSLPRASTWPGAPSAKPAESGEGPGLSESLREQVRARLEAQAARLATAPAPEPKRRLRAERPAKRRGLGLDLEQERVRIEAELHADVARLEGLDLYARLELTPGAPDDEVERSFARISTRMEPERALAGLSAPDLRLLAEQRLVLVRRAHATLTDPHARARYHRKLGLERQPEDAPVIAADEAFARGLERMRAADWGAARGAFTEAVEKNPSEGAYLSHLGWATYSADPENEDSRETALDLLRKAAELNPRHESVYVFAGRVQQQIGRTEAAREAFQRALRCNPDCVEALEACHALAPKAAKKSGFLSRFGR